LLDLIVGKRPRLRRDCDSKVFSIVDSIKVGKRPRLRRDCDLTRNMKGLEFFEVGKRPRLRRDCDQRVARHKIRPA